MKGGRLLQAAGLVVHLCGDESLRLPLGTKVDTFDSGSERWTCAIKKGELGNVEGLTGGPGNAGVSLRSEDFFVDSILEFAPREFAEADMTHCTIFKPDFLQLASWSEEPEKVVTLPRCVKEKILQASATLN